MTPTDTQLKAALAKMLPEKITYLEADNTYRWLVSILLKSGTTSLMIDMRKEVLDTELLRLCYLAECQILRTDEIGLYMEAIDEDGDWNLCHATWQQRVISLCKVKGIEI